MKDLSRIAAFFKSRQLLVLIIIAVALSLVMTVISLRLYSLDDVSRLDVSLPNRESIRPSTANDEAQKFDSFGALDSQALSDFQRLYAKNRSALDALGKFDGDALSGASLQMGTNE